MEGATKAGFRFPICFGRLKSRRAQPSRPTEVNRSDANHEQGRDQEGMPWKTVVWIGQNKKYANENAERKERNREQTMPCQGELSQPGMQARSSRVTAHE